MNLTTLLVPLFGLQMLARALIAPRTAYVDLSYRQVLALSCAYQARIVGWVAFWALYGQGFTASNLHGVVTFGSAYMLVVIVEPLIDLAVLAAARSAGGLRQSMLVTPRLFAAS